MLFNDITMFNRPDPEAIPTLRRHCDDIKSELSEMYHRRHSCLHETDSASLAVVYVYINLLQETREMVSGLRKYMRSYGKLHDSAFSGQ